MTTGFNIPSVSANGTNPPKLNFSLPAGLSLLWNIVKPITYPGIREQAEQATPDISYSGIQVVEDDENPPLSHIGTPILYPIQLKAGTYRRYDSQGRIQEVQMPDLRLPMASVVEMSRSKRIVKTDVAAAQGSVKEIYGFDDWSVRISGIMIDEPNHPQGRTTIESMQESLQDFFDLADSIEVDGSLFHTRGVYRLVMKSLSYNQFPGKPRVHGYQLECESDAPLELILQ